MPERTKEVAELETLRAVRLFSDLVKVEKDITSLNKQRCELVDGIKQSMSLASQLSFGGKSWTEEHMKANGYGEDEIKNFWGFYNLMK